MYFICSLRYNLWDLFFSSPHKVINIRLPCQDFAQALINLHEIPHNLSFCCLSSWNSFCIKLLHLLEFSVVFSITTIFQLKFIEQPNSSQSAVQQIILKQLTLMTRGPSFIFLSPSNFSKLYTHQDLMTKFYNLICVYIHNKCMFFNK